MTEWGHEPGHGPGHEPSHDPGHDPRHGQESSWPDWTDPARWSEAGVESDPFPPALEIDVSPADGGPWVDPRLLGGADERAADLSVPDPVPPTDPPAALLSDLAAADGEPDAGWDEVHGSDDPAVRALAARWHF
jgi:hypothetical protein